MFSEIGHRTTGRCRRVEVGAAPLCVSTRDLPDSSESAPSDGVLLSCSISRMAPPSDLSATMKGLLATRTMIGRPRRLIAVSIISCGPVSPARVRRIRERNCCVGNPMSRLRKC